MTNIWRNIMRTFLTILALLATAVLIYASYTLTMGLQEDFPFEGYIGMFLVLLCMCIPTLCIGALIEDVNNRKWDEHYRDACVFISKDIDKDMRS
jgi:hypothetical protein